MVAFPWSAGHSVCALVHGFEPYFYVRAPAGLTVDDLPTFRRSLEVLIPSRATADSIQGEKEGVIPVFNVWSNVGVPCCTACGGVWVPYEGERDWWAKFGHQILLIAVCERGERCVHQI